MLGRVEEKADQRGRSLIVSSFVFFILYSVFVVKPHFSILVNQLCVHISFCCVFIQNCISLISILVARTISPKLKTYLQNNYNQLEMKARYLGQQLVMKIAALVSLLFQDRFAFPCCFSWVPFALVEESIF